MSLVLIVEDMAVIRELLHGSLANAGFQTQCVANGQAALAAVKARIPDLILLDLSMPVMGGLAVLEKLRSSPATARVPVILLTASGDKGDVVKAVRLGVHDYLLKNQFSLTDLLNRVRKYIEPPEPRIAVGGERARIAVALDGKDHRGLTAIPGNTSVPAGQPRSDGSAQPGRLTREQTLERIDKYTQSRTLAGVVADVIALTNSPHASVAELVTLLKRDAVICARVIQVANTATFATHKPCVSTIDEAVRNIGLTAVRGIATSVGFFDAFPPDAKDGFNLIRCWQHSFAVAAIMERIVPTSPTVPAGVAHLVGLCHDLGEIVLRQCFAAEYADAVESAAQCGDPLADICQAAFGFRHQELSDLVLGKLGLPPAITTPIRDFMDPARSKGGSAASLPQAIHLANLYSHGMLLASSPHAPVAPLTQAECRAVAGNTPPQVDTQGLRCEVLSNTSLLARLSREDESRLSRPLFAASVAKVWYARHPSYSSFDPLGTALQSLAQTQVFDRLPTDPSELNDYAAMVVVSPRPGIGPLPLEDAASVAANGRHLPVLYLCPHAGESLHSPAPHVRHETYQISLSRLADFVAGLPANLAAPTG